MAKILFYAKIYFGAEQKLSILLSKKNFSPKAKDKRSSILKLYF